jgi:hypothetical protein
MVTIAVANGLLREAVLKKLLPELQAHQVSTVLLVVFLALYIGAVLRVWPPGSAGHALAIGLGWVVLTVAFETLLGHYISGRSWRELGGDYDLLAGRIWILVPLCLLVSPSLLYRWARA